MSSSSARPSRTIGAAVIREDSLLSKGELGFASGVGGAVTQVTSRTTGVTLSTVTGQITTTTGSIAGLSAATFTVTNTHVGAADTIIACKVSGDIDTDVSVSAVRDGSFDITLRNTNAVIADTTAAVINFALIKGTLS